MCTYYIHRRVRPKTEIFLLLFAALLTPKIKLSRHKMRDNTGERLQPPDRALGQSRLHLHRILIHPEPTPSILRAALPPLSVLTAATPPCRHIHLLHSGGRISELLAWPEAYAASDHISDAVDSAARPGPLGCSGGGSCKRVRRRRSASSPFLAQFQIPPSRFDNQSPPNIIG